MCIRDRFVHDNMGYHFDKYIPLIGAIFALSIGCNLISVIGLWSPTADQMCIRDRYVGALSVDWGKCSAAATITIVPIVIVGFFMQKYLVSGMTAGAVKG